MFEVEKALIACMVMDNSIISEVVCNVKPEEFASKWCRSAFKMIGNLYNKNKQVDAAIIANISEDYKFILEFCSLVKEPKTSYKNYIKIMKDNLVKNDLNKIVGDIRNRLNNQDYKDIESLRVECLNKFNFETQIKNSIDGPVISYLDKFVNDIKNTDDEEMVIRTGFEKLDKKMGDGIFPGLYIMGAISSLGKTAFALQMADRMARLENHVIFFSLEMPRYELICRSISRHMFMYNRRKCADVGTLTIMRGNLSGYSYELAEAIEDYKLSAEFLTIEETGFNVHVDDIRNKIQSYIVRYNRKPVVFIDYLQILRADGKTDKQMMDNVVVALKTISRDFAIPVIAVSSFNRANYSTRVDYECFKETGAIEYTADVLMGLQLSVLNNMDTSDKNKSINKQRLMQAKAEIPRRITAVILKQRNARANVQQDFLYFPVNNFIQEV